MSWYNWLPAIIGGTAALGGAIIQSNAVNNAAQTAATASNNATNAQLQGLELSRQVIAQNQAAASPGLTQVQEIIKRGNQLTPSQVTALDDARRTTLNQLSGSGLRGSARATAATVKKVEGDMRSQFLDSNQSRADTAASNLSSQYFNAGNNLANNATAAGQTTATGLTSVGDINASAGLGNAATTGRALGDIGAIIADEIKRNNRDSSYNQPTTGV